MVFCDCEKFCKGSRNIKQKTWQRHAPKRLKNRLAAAGKHVVDSVQAGRKRPQEMRNLPPAKRVSHGTTYREASPNQEDCMSADTDIPVSVFLVVQNNTY